MNRPRKVPRSRCKAVEIDCRSNHDAWIDLAFEKIQANEGFKLLNVPIRESGPVESLAQRNYYLNIVGYDQATGVARAIHFIPWQE